MGKDMEVIVYLQILNGILLSSLWMYMRNVMNVLIKSSRLSAMSVDYDSPVDSNALRRKYKFRALLPATLYSFS
jgi:hypothetical protein